MNEGVPGGVASTTREAPGGVLLLKCTTFTFPRLCQGGELTVEVVGSSGVAAAWGLHHYLQQHCGAQVYNVMLPDLGVGCTYYQVTWDHQQLALPRSLPRVNTTLKVKPLVILGFR